MFYEPTRRTIFLAHFTLFSDKTRDSSFFFLLQGRRLSSQCPRWRRRALTATASQRRTAPRAGRFPECGSPPLCATPAWRSLPLKCSEFPPPASEQHSHIYRTVFSDEWTWDEENEHSLTVSSLPADFRTPVRTAATRLRWDSRCACVPAPTKWDPRRSATASPSTRASATPRSSGSPRSRAARSSTDCSSGWSERERAAEAFGWKWGEGPRGAPRTFNKTDNQIQPLPWARDSSGIQLLWIVDNSALLISFLFLFGCLLLDSFNGRGLRRFQRRTDTACTLCFGHS